MSNICLSVLGHVNNLYNTSFWTLIQKGGLTTVQAEERLKVRRLLGQVLVSPVHYEAFIWVTKCNFNFNRNLILKSLCMHAFSLLLYYYYYYVIEVITYFPE